MFESTIFAGYRDEDALESVRRVLEFLGEPGAEHQTLDVALAMRGPGQPIWEASRPRALAALSTLQAWGFVTKDLYLRTGNYVWTRTERPAHELDAAHVESRKRILAARAASRQVTA